jgi:divalent metal cation (Fe/Co/Zn/Cd) transporter
VFLDLHIWMAAGTRLDAAHEISHDVKDRLMTKFPQIGDAIIHLEPPPRDDDPRNLLPPSHRGDVSQRHRGHRGS